MQDERLKPKERDCLRSSDLLRGTAPDLTAAILDACIIRTYEKATVIFKQGDPNEGICAVLSGLVKFSKLTASGTEISLGLQQPGEWAGELSLLDGLGRTHDGYAIVNTRTAWLRPDDIKDLSNQYPEFYRTLVQLVCALARDALRDIDRVLALRPEQLLALRLCDLTQAVSPAGELSITQDDLAALIGISRQSINKILTKWSRLRIVRTYRGGIQILNMDGLNAIAESD